MTVKAAFERGRMPANETVDLNLGRNQRMRKLWTLGLALALVAAPAMAATYTVTSGDADTDTAGTFMWAVDQAVDGDTIDFDGDYTIPIVGARQPYYSDLVLDTWVLGDEITIDATGHDVLFDGAPGAAYDGAGGGWKGNSGLYVLHNGGTQPESMTVIGIKVRGNRTNFHMPNGATTGIVLQNCTFYEGDKLISLENTGPVDAKAAYRATIQGCTIYNADQAGIAVENTALGAYLIENNNIYACGQDDATAYQAGVAIADNVAAELTDVMITGNVFWSNTPKDIVWYGGGTPTAVPAIASVDAAGASGTAEADSSVDVYANLDGINAAFLGTVTADGSGNWTLTEDLSAYEGWDIFATATGANGNTSENSASSSFGQSPIPAAGAGLLVLAGAAALVLGVRRMRK